MTQVIQLRKAERKKAKLRIGLGGPSGSGKTYSALLMANGMAPWEKIALIDTENGSGELYSDLGPYNVVTLIDDFAPENYVEAIHACENAGMEVIIIDSITHEWDGKGGCLELVDRLGGKFQDWGKVTPRHKRFVEAIIQSKCHMITSVRKKQDYDMTKDQNGRVKVEKVGMKEITREGFEYELTLSFELDLRHNAKASKDRTGLFMDRPEMVIDQKVGKELLNWANSGADLSKEDTVTNQKKEIASMLKEMEPNINWKVAGAEIYATKIKELCGLELVEINYSAILTKLQEVRQARTDATLAEIEAIEAKKENQPAPAPATPVEANVDPVANALGLDEKDIPQKEESAAAKLMRQGMEKNKKDPNKF